MRRSMFVFLLAVVVANGGRPASVSAQATAQAYQNCLQTYSSCIYAAAVVPDFWSRTIMALDCEINLWSCLKHSFIF